jgi:hypothetical protein
VQRSEREPEYVAFGLKADMTPSNCDVRFTPERWGNRPQMRGGAMSLLVNILILVGVAGTGLEVIDFLMSDKQKECVSLIAVRFWNRLDDVNRAFIKYISHR